MSRETTSSRETHECNRITYLIHIILINNPYEDFVIPSQSQISILELITFITTILFFENLVKISKSTLFKSTPRVILSHFYIWLFSNQLFVLYIV